MKVRDARIRFPIYEAMYGLYRKPSLGIDYILFPFPVEALSAPYAYFFV